MVWIFDSNSYFVDPSQADDTGDGRTEANAKKTIAAVLGLTPPAGSTIFLAGGTHTIATASQITVPTNVKWIGSGRKSTFVQGDTEDELGLFYINGVSASFESMSIAGIGGDLCHPFELTTAASILELKNCTLAGDGTSIQAANPVSNRHRLVVDDCIFDIELASAIKLTGAIDLIVSNCQFAGDSLSLWSTLSTQLQTVVWINNVCNALHRVSTTVPCMDLAATGTGGVLELTIEGSSFFPGASKAIETAESGGGSIIIYNNGGNNLTPEMLDLANDGIPVSNAPAFIQGTNTEVSDTSIISSILDDVDDAYIGSIVHITSGTYKNFTRTITDSVSSTNTITFEALPDDLVNGDTFEIIPSVLLTKSNVLAAVWGAFATSYGAAGTFGGLINDIGDALQLVSSGTATAGSLLTITIGNAPGADNYYKDCLIVLVAGSGLNQARYIENHVDATKVITFDRPLKVAASTDTVYKIYSVMAPTKGIFLDTTVSGGDATAVTLANADDRENYYVGCRVEFTGGTYVGEVRRVAAYDNDTHEITFDVVLAGSPSAGDPLRIYQTSETADGLSTITDKLPSDSKKMAGEGVIAKNLDQVSGGVVGGGGAPVHGRMDYVGFLDNRVLDVIAGEEQRLTVVLETDGTFPLPITDVSVRAVDSGGTVVTVLNAGVDRVVEDSQVYVFRFTLSAAETATFTAGVLNLEVRLDDSWSQIMSAIEIISSLS